MEKARIDGMAQQFARIHNGAPETVDRIRSVFEPIGRGRHLVLLSRGRRWRVDLLYRWSGLRAPRAFKDVMHDHAHEAQHGAEQSDRLEDVLPHRKRQRNSRFRRKVAILLRLVDVMKHIDNAGAAYGLRVVHAGILEAGDVAQLFGAVLGQELHVVLGAEVQAPGRTRLYAGRFQSCSHSVRAEGALVNLLRAGVELGDVEGAAGDAELAAPSTSPSSTPARRRFT